MTRQEHLLTILAEECAEVAQRVTKCLRFGIREIQPVDTGGDGIRDNVERLVAELNDQAAVIQMLQADGVFDGPIYSAHRIGEKKRKVEHFLEYSERCGTLSPVGAHHDTVEKEREERQ